MIVTTFNRVFLPIWTRRSVLFLVLATASVYTQSPSNPGKPNKITLSKPPATIEALDVADAVVSDTMFVKARAGEKIVAVKFRVKNTGDTPFNLLPSEIQLKNSDDEQFDASLGDAKTPGLKSGPIDPGDQVSGWVSYVVPTNTKATALRFRYSAFMGESSRFVPIDIRASVEPLSKN